MPSAVACVSGVVEAESDVTKDMTAGRSQARPRLPARELQKFQLRNFAIIEKLLRICYSNSSLL